jgi:hypothetical protein
MSMWIVFDNITLLCSSLSRVSLDANLKKKLMSQQGTYYEAGKNILIVNGRGIDPETVDPYKYDMIILVSHLIKIII